MRNKLKFFVGSLVAAGFGASSADAESNTKVHQNENFFDSVKSIVESLKNVQGYTLAQHRSHMSHGSHASHGSHRSYHHPPEIDDMNDDLRAKPQISLDNQASVRNENSTPRSTVLPSSPAIAQKLKPLPGNSKKFKHTVTSAQLALVARGYDVGSVSGEIDAKTMAAVFKFQKNTGFAPDGKLTPEVLTALNVDAK